jgi:hypothetical protein
VPVVPHTTQPITTLPPHFTVLLGANRDWLLRYRGDVGAGWQEDWMQVTAHTAVTSGGGEEEERGYEISPALPPRAVDF